MNWNKPPAIIGRRKNEQKLFAEHVYSNNGKVTVYPADGQGKVQWKRGKTVDLTNEIDKT
jgi:lysozyme